LYLLINQNGDKKKQSNVFSFTIQNFPFGKLEKGKLGYKDDMSHTE